MRPLGGYQAHKPPCAWAVLTLSAAGNVSDGGIL